MDESIPDVVYGTSCGLSLSTDGGETWREFFRSVRYSVTDLVTVDERLLVRATLPALKALVDNGYVGRDDGSALHDAYKFLRTVEHAEGDGVPIALKDVISTKGVETTAAWTPGRANASSRLVVKYTSGN